MMKFNHFNFNVFDLQKSLDFYKKALDLDVIRKIDAEDGSFQIVFVGNKETAFCLELTYLVNRTKPYDLGDKEYHLAFTTDNYDEVHQKHSEMGIICFENPAMGIYFIEDPDGYWIEIIPETK